MDRRAALAAIGTAVLAGCLGRDGNASPDRTTVRESERTPTAASGPPTADETLPLTMAPDAIRQSAVSGGPPKDGIPSIDDPNFVPPDEAPSGLAPGDPVFGVAMGGEAKAYPQAILAHHEICNDTVDGTPVSVTYCPLTGTAMGFHRGGTTFGVSGRLFNNNLIMYDRATEAWWPQVLATSVPGPWNAAPGQQSLRQFPVVWTTWERWRRAYPETALLSRDTGYARNYDADPYGSYNPRKGYYAPDSSPMFSALSADDRLATKAVVIGARTRDGAVAFAKARLREDRLVKGAIGETPVVAAYDPDLDTAWVYRNPEEQSFEYRDGEVVDGDGNAAAPDSLPLDPIVAFDAMWFAWIGFYPETELHA
jgi:hypothetical protein